MTRRTYTLEPQRLRPGFGYVPCEPHQACRVVILEITSVPGKNGRKPYRITKTHQMFAGSAMMLRARQQLDLLIRGTNKRPDRGPPGVWGRSLTLAEYIGLAPANRRRLP